MRRHGWMWLVLMACGGGGPDGGGPGGPPGGQGGAGGAPPEPVTVVELTTATPGAVVDALLASAMVEALRSADVIPVATGIVLRVEVDVGDEVKKGDLLAVLQNVSLDAGAERAGAEVRNLEAKLAEAEALAAQGAISAREVVDLRTQLATARISAREASATAKETRLVAPFDGVVAARDLRIGEQASAAKRAFQVVDLTSLRVTANLPERDVGRVKLGQPATLTAAYDNTLTAKANVTRISPVIDATTGTFQVILTLESGTATLRPGQYVSVSVEVDRRQDVLVLPRPAITYDNGRPIVYRVTEAPPEEAKEGSDSDAEVEADGFFAKWFGGSEEPAEETDAAPPEPVGPKLVAERINVELGLVDVATAEIKGGLSAGDRVVLVGQANLKDGSRVREPAPPAAEGEATPAPEGEAAPAEPATPAQGG